MAEIQSHLNERRKFKPKSKFLAGTRFSDPAAFERWRKKANKNPESFWSEQAKELVWSKPFKKVFTGTFQKPEWFKDGKLNACINAVDRNLWEGRRHKAALIFEGERGDQRVITYQQLALDVNRLANVMKSHGVVAGDVVTLYMGMGPEAVISMLACARMGATHNVVFGGFSGEALSERMRDSASPFLITQDGTYRKGKAYPLKKAVHEHLGGLTQIKSVFVFRRTFDETPMQEGRDHFVEPLMRTASVECEAVAVPAEHPLFVLYTSGSTGKPKGLVHSTGGYLTQARTTSQMVLDLKDDDLYFCTADVGWVTGHTYVTYGPLMLGATVFLYEGTFDTPDFGRIWDMIERHRITVLYTAPTAIRSFMRAGDDYLNRHDVSSLRLLGSVGEPINPEAWMWYFERVGRGNCPIVDTWWQTETGGHMIAPVPGIQTLKPGTATLPLPGIDADVVNSQGKPLKASVKTAQGGLLVVKRPWPGQARTILNDHDRYVQTYFSEVPGMYFSGDGARKDNDGNIWIMGRVDDVVNVSGHRLGTAEIESALVSDARVAEAAVVAKPDDLKGQALVAFVVLKQNAVGNTHPEKLIVELKEGVAKGISPIAKPDEIRIVDQLPKTRSGKIMRRLLRELVTTGEMRGDKTSLAD